MKSIILFAVFVASATAMPLTSPDASDEKTVISNIPVEQDDVKEESFIGEEREENQQENAGEIMDVANESNTIDEADDEIPARTEEIVEVTTTAVLDKVTQVADEQKETVVDENSPKPVEFVSLPSEAWFRIVFKTLKVVYAKVCEALESFTTLPWYE